MDDVFEKEVSMGKSIESASMSFSSNEYSSGESFSIIYKKLHTAEEVLALIDESEVVRLSKFKDGEEVEHSFEDYIYNDTDKYAKIAVKTISGGADDYYTMGKGEIWGFDWMIDSATVTF